jgi:hypothetical protein
MKTFKVDGGKLYSADVKDIRKNIGVCQFCKIPVYVSSGQIYSLRNKKPFHKRCLKAGLTIMRR